MLVLLLNMLLLGADTPSEKQVPLNEIHLRRAEGEPKTLFKATDAPWMGEMGFGTPKAGFITGVTWEECVAGCCMDCYGKVPVRYLGKQELIQNKRTLGRAKDLADIEALEGTR